MARVLYQKGIDIVSVVVLFYHCLSPSTETSAFSGSALEPFAWPFDTAASSSFSRRSISSWAFLIF
jgi:hypothetical protein